MIEHTGPVTLHANGLSTIDCRMCGFVHLDPLPAQEDLDCLYRDEYYQKHQGWFEKERREQWYWRRVYLARAKCFEQIFGSPSPNQSRLIEDVGAGCGWFAKAIDRWHNSVVWSYEPSFKARLWGKQNLGATVNSFHPQRRLGFEFIHCALVLEHVSDPLGELIEIKTRLAPSGVLCVVVPNEFNPLQQELSRRYGYSPIGHHHLNYFTQQSLTALIERAGFEIVRATSTFPIEWFALHGLNYVKHPRLGSAAHWLRMALETAALRIDPERWERTKDGWATKGIGREIELWAKRGA